jgi:nitroreductase
MEFYEVVAKRQSVRKYKPDPVPEDALSRIVEAFRASPSWANTQPWELVWVQDTELKRRLQETVPKNNPSYPAVADAPVLACAIGILGRSGYYKGQVSTGRGDWMLFDLGIASEHLSLAAAAEGLGTVHIGLFDYEKANAVLGLPSGRTVVELIPLGYPAFVPKRVERKPVAEFVFRDGYPSRS